MLSLQHTTTSARFAGLEARESRAVPMDVVVADAQATSRREAIGGAPHELTLRAGPTRNEIVTEVSDEPRSRNTSSGDFDRR